MIFIADRHFCAYRRRIERWLSIHERSRELPIYLSADIRDAGYKCAVVDTNLFPAGFNNIHPGDHRRASKVLGEEIRQRQKGARHVLIVIEEHTRNLWYLENVYVLSRLIKDAGFRCSVAMIDGDFSGRRNMRTAQDHEITVYSLASWSANEAGVDFVLLNNDLSNGIPDEISAIDAPVYPNPKIGWHSRLKSRHFILKGGYVDEFAAMINLDPWLFSCLYAEASRIDVFSDKDRIVLADICSDLFMRIRAKYREHHIDEKPFVFLKSNSGTYGIGVLPVSDPKEIIALNRKKKNNLARGKGGRSIDSYFLQEGVPSRLMIDGYTAEVCIYKSGSRPIGGFYRFHSQKGPRENLNSNGMRFKSFITDCRCRSCLNPQEVFVYNTLTRLAVIAAQREMEILDRKREPELLSIQ